METMNLKANKLILGHMPFVGVSYQSAEKDEEYRKRFSKISATRNIVEAALKMGVHRFAGATPRSSPPSPVHIEALRAMIDEGHDIELLPCIEIPVRLGDNRIDAFRRWATYMKFERRLFPEVRRMPCMHVCEYGSCLSDKAKVHILHYHVKDLRNLN